MMDAYNARGLTEQAFDCCKNDLDGRRFGSGDLFSVKDRFFVKLVALVLRGLKLGGVTVDDVLRSIRLVGFGGVCDVTEVSKRNRDLCGALGINVPSMETYTHI